MIDSQELQQLLKNTKLSSMSDVIQFILEQLYKLVHFQPIQEMAFRLTELEKPKGLDNIMLEEVKTLIEAMLEQKEDQIRKDVERTVQFTMEQETSRRALRQMDIMENVARESSKNNRMVTDQKPSHHQNQAQLDSIKKQITELKLINERRVEKSEYNNFKFEMQRQMSNKMGISETEKIVEKFQRDIFNKLSDTHTYVTRMQYEVKKTMLSEVGTIKKQMMESIKMIDLKELKDKCSKFDKKFKKIDAEQTNISLKMKESICLAEKQSKQSKESIEQLCTCIQNIDAKLKHIQSTLAQIQQCSMEQAYQIQVLQSSSANQISYGVWTADNKSNIKNMSILWERESTNTNPEVFKYEQNKSQIIVTEPGYYIVECYVAGCEYGPELTINGASIYKLESNEGRQNEINGRSLGNASSGGGCKFMYGLRETLKFGEGANKIGIKLENSYGYGSAIIKIRRMA